MKHKEEAFSSKTANAWKKIGHKRLAGICVPVFSVYSQKSCGIGEIMDLKLLIDWEQKAGFSILQLLPMNDVGHSFRPYDGESSFALEPVYLSLESLENVSLKSFSSKIQALRESFPVGPHRVNYAVKQKKMDLLWEIFQTIKNDSNSQFNQFQNTQSYWLEDYALFKVLKEIHNGREWESWAEGYKKREQAALSEIRQKHFERILFWKWIQWQLFSQMQAVKEYGRTKNVLIFGDLPFLVSRDSADVWSHPDYFKLDFVSGAPPDMYISNGQRWGMPPYNWQAIERDDYEYVSKKLSYAEKFYDLFRIDHVVGTFRIWIIPAVEPLENAGMNGVFDPEPEEQWEGHGRKLLEIMIKNTSMLPCGEDLGVIPPVCPKVLEDLAIPGMDVQRWAKYWATDATFKKREDYRELSISVISSHDMSNLLGWWRFESGTVDEGLFTRICREKNIPIDRLKGQLFDLNASHYGRLFWKEELREFSQIAAILNKPENEIADIKDLYMGSKGERQKFFQILGLNPDSIYSLPDQEWIEKALEYAHAASSVFSIQLLQDWLFLEGKGYEKPWDDRVNFPGTMGDHNWSLRLPFSLEQLASLNLADKIRNILIKTKRCV